MTWWQWVLVILGTAWAALILAVIVGGTIIWRCTAGRGWRW